MAGISKETAKVLYSGLGSIFKENKMLKATGYRFLKMLKETG